MKGDYFNTTRVELLRNYVGLENLEQNTPEYLLKVIAKIISVFLYRLNIPRKEVEAFTDQLERSEFAMLFDSFEAYDVQETRRVSKAEGKAEGKAEAILDLLSELGTVPSDLRTLIMTETDLDVLKRMLKFAAKSNSVDEFRRYIVS